MLDYLLTDWSIGWLIYLGGGKGGGYAEDAGGVAGGGWEAGGPLHYMHYAG